MVTIDTGIARKKTNWGVVLKYVDKKQNRDILQTEQTNQHVNENKMKV